VAAGVERHAEQALVAELVPQLLPVLVGELVDVLRAPLGDPGALDAVGEDRPVGDEVGVDARVWLDVGVRRPEQLASRVASAMRGSTEAMTSRAWLYALLIRASVMETA
jgi:hypothetical protein